MPLLPDLENWGPPRAAWRSTSPGRYAALVESVEMYAYPETMAHGTYKIEVSHDDLEAFQVPNAETARAQAEQMAAREAVATLKAFGFDLDTLAAEAEIGRAYLTALEVYATGSDIGPAYEALESLIEAHKGAVDEG